AFLTETQHWVGTLTGMRKEVQRPDGHCTFSLPQGKSSRPGWNTFVVTCPLKSYPLQCESGATLPGCPSPLLLLLTSSREPRSGVSPIRHRLWPTHRPTSWKSFGGSYHT